jgi:hypothetical protein
VGIGFYFLLSGLVIVQAVQESSLISGGATAVSVLSSFWTITLCALSEKTPTRSILCIVYGIGILCLLNVVAELAGVSIALYSERTEVIGSRYKDGGFRWQSPLFSSWQLSGLARWAGPAGIILGIGVLKSKVERFLAVGYICTILLVLVRVEYRAALIPFSFVPFWYFIKSSRFRRIGCVMVIIYTLAAPWIYSSYIVHDVVEAILPEALVRMAGTTREQIATMSERTDLWSAATEYLQSGEYFWRGQGLLGLDASFLAVIDTSVYEGLIERYSFHQGALDVLYIFGTLGGGLLIILLLWTVLHIASAGSYSNQYSQVGTHSNGIRHFSKGEGRPHDRSSF